MSTQNYLDSFTFLNKSQVNMLSKKERMTYEDSLKYYRDIKNVIDTAEKTGEEKGVQKGVKKNQLENAKNALLEGLSFEIISKITKLSVEEIQKIADSLNK